MKISKSLSSFVYFAIPALIFVGIVCIMSFVALHPFSLKAKNGAFYNAQRKAYCLDKGIIVDSDTINNGEKKSFDKKSMTLELVYAPAKRPADYKETIVTFYSPKKLPAFRIVQWHYHCIVETFRNGKWVEFATPEQLQKRIKQCITIATDSVKTTLYVNGRLVTATQYGLLVQSDGLCGTMLLGNSETAKTPWYGYLYGLALYQETLSPALIEARVKHWLTNDSMNILLPSTVMLYDFSKGANSLMNLAQTRHVLAISEYLPVLKYEYLVPFWEDFSWGYFYLSDIIINIIGFMPFGCFFALLLSYLLPQKRFSFILIFTVISGFACSLTIETVQVFMVERTSQLSDLIDNTLGTFLGGLLYGPIGSLWRFLWLQKKNYTINGGSHGV